jgi:hypothetical protein
MEDIEAEPAADSQQHDGHGSRREACFAQERRCRNLGNEGAHHVADSDEVARRTEMIAPPDSDMMSPPGPVPRWRLDCWHRFGAVVIIL